MKVSTPTVLPSELELEKLRFEIACLKRVKYGRSFEQLDQQLTDTAHARGSRVESGGEAGSYTARPQGATATAYTSSTAERRLREEVVHECSDPLISCSGVILLGDTHEHSDGRRDQAMDSAA